MPNYTFEVSHNEPVHPDPQVAATFTECDFPSPPTCEYGCKIYGNPRSNERVLVHNSNYGCFK